MVVGYKSDTTDDIMDINEPKYLNHFLDFLKIKNQLVTII